MSKAEVYFDQSLDRKNRLTYSKVFIRPPGLNADIQNAAESARMIVDPDFEILGTNASSDDATIATTGGVTIETDGGDNDFVVILPHLDASQSAWATTLWDTAKSPSYETTIETGASVAATEIWAGFKLTNVFLNTTDNDSIYFLYDSVTTSWQFNVSRAGTDETYTVPTDICAAVAASTRYRLRIEVYSDRTCMGFINDKPIRETRFAAVTSLTTLIPYTGVMAAAAAAKKITVKYLEVGRAY